MRFSYYATMAAMLFVLASCSDSIVSDCGDTTDPPTAVRASFGDIQQKVFDVSCAVPGCHAGSAPQANLDLGAGASYDMLVGAPSLNYPGELRVRAGESSSSVLVALLRGEKGPAMPPAGALPAAVIDSIALWIDSGAKNN